MKYALNEGSDPKQHGGSCTHCFGITVRRKHNILSNVLNFIHNHLASFLVGVWSFVLVSLLSVLLALRFSVPFVKEGYLNYRDIDK